MLNKYLMNELMKPNLLILASCSKKKTKRYNLIFVFIHYTIVDLSRIQLSSMGTGPEDKSQ